MTRSGKKIVIAYFIDFIMTEGGISGGTERQVIDTIKRINRELFKPILITLRDSSSSNLNDIECEKYNLNLQSFFSVKSFILLIKIARLLKIKKVDIVQTFFIDSTLFGVLAAKIAGVSAIINCRRDMGFWYTKPILLLMRILNRLSDRILVNARAIKENLVKSEKIESEKVDIIYNGIDTDFIDQIPKKNIDSSDKINRHTFTVGIVANFNRRVKRVDLFIHAAARVYQQLDNVNFIIIGSGNLFAELHRLATELKIESKIVFMGSQQSALPFIKNFDVGLNTSDSEGFSNVILEYMAAGKPVIATNVGGNKELVVDNVTGFLTPKGDENSLAEKIIMLLLNEKLRTEMGKKSREIIKLKCDWKYKIKEVESYYEHLMEIKN